MIDLLELSTQENPGLAFDTARALVETVCKTILAERMEEFDETWDLPRLLKNTLAAVALVPDSHSEEVAALLRRLGGGLQTTTQALGELRNKAGFVSHGRVAYWPELDRIHAIVAARAAETIVYLVYMAHVNYPPVVVERDPQYRDFENFNAYLDEMSGPIRIAGIEYSASELLWYSDSAAYRGLKAEFDAADRSEDVEQ